jgi:hypothetical protein
MGDDVWPYLKHLMYPRCWLTSCYHFCMPGLKMIRAFALLLLLLFRRNPKAQTCCLAEGVCVEVEPTLGKGLYRDSVQHETPYSLLVSKNLLQPEFHK